MITEKTTLSLDEENLEEASFLYGQRCSLLDDPGLYWQDLDEHEERLDADIDALVMSGESALVACKRKALEGDSAEHYIAIRVFCRQQRLDCFMDAIDSIDPDNKDKLNAVRRALEEEMPDAWNDHLFKLFSENHAVISKIFPGIAGYRRLPCRNELMHALKTAAPEAMGDIAWALGRLGAAEAGDLLYSIITQTPNAADISCIAMALLRIGDTRMLPFLRNAAETAFWPLIPLGLCGGASDVRLVHEILKNKKAAKEALPALGLLGSVSSIETLIGYLKKNNLAEAASQALYLITGAELFEEPPILQDPDDEEFFEAIGILDEIIEDISSSQTGPGSTIKKISREPNSWQQWWKCNKQTFSEELRYRNGKPFSPLCLLENMTSQILPRRFRQLAYEELVIRYNIDLPFETEMTVAKQAQVISLLSQWAKEKADEFQAGAWHQREAKTSFEPVIIIQDKHHGILKNTSAPNPTFAVRQHSL